MRDTKGLSANFRHVPRGHLQEQTDEGQAAECGEGMAT